MKTTALYRIILSLITFNLLSNTVFAVTTDGRFPPSQSHRSTPLVEAVQKAVPAVVNISTERVVTVSDPFDAFFRDFFSQPPARYYRESIPLGSGVVIARQGLVLTNLHVIRRASNIEVRMMDGTSFRARLVAYDQSNDLALLRLRQEPQAEQTLNLDSLEFVLPDDLLLAETVIAVGNPFGLESSVTSGVLSARNRQWREGEVEFNDILQTDTAINPGNSGGPLVNLDGQMIGLNLAIRAGAEGIGFAIPVRRIEEVLSKWLLPEYFSTGTCGFIPANQLDRNGEWQVIATQVDPEGPAARAGLREGDIIKAVNGNPTIRSLQVNRRLWQLRPGDNLTITSENGRKITFDVEEMGAAQLIAKRLGVQVQDLSEPLKKALRIPDSIEGLIISEVLPDGAARTAGLRRGDIIHAVGRSPVKEISDIHSMLRNFTPGETVQLQTFVFRTFRQEPLLQQRSLRVMLH